jgi:hypothetical protein
MTDRIIIMGTASCLEFDLAAIARLDPVAAERTLHGERTYDFLAVGLDCADRYLGRIEHAVSYHPKEFPAFQERRAKAGGNLDYVTHTHNDPTNNADRIWPYFSPSGSSTMLGVEVALGLGYKKIIVAGCLLMDHGYRRFQEGWQVRFETIKNAVRAMSGFPRELLGAPTEEWLNEKEAGA